MILLNPGPANTTETVKRALVCEDVCPREHEFGEVMERVAKGLVRVVHEGDRYLAVLMCGSGTAAVESAIASTVPDAEHGGRLLVIDNGAYGARMAEIAAAYKMPHDVERAGVGGWPDVTRIGERLATGRYTQLAVVHHETTTGMLNPVEQIGALCKEHGVDLIVDAMSSYAGVPIDVEKMGADYLISSANKCIQGMAGVSFVIARKEKLEALRPIPGRSLYLNLGENHRFFVKNYQMRYTPPVQILHALDRALVEHFAEGQKAKSDRYRACFDALDGGMRELGFKRLLPEAQLSKILTAYIEPGHPKYGYDPMHDILKRKGFTIYPGKGAAKATFRLANMGAITPDDMFGFVRAMAETIGEMGIRPLYSNEAQS